MACALSLPLYKVWSEAESPATIGQLPVSMQLNGGIIMHHHPLYSRNRINRMLFQQFPKPFTRIKTGFA